MLWASPTQGEPIDFRGVPPGGRVYLAMRPAEMLSSEEGQLVFDALGPEATAARQAWEKAAGVTLDQVEQMVITLLANDEKFPRAAFTVRLTSGGASDELVARWGGAKAESVESATIYNSGAWSYFVPEDGEGKSFTMGAKEDILEVATVRGAAPALNRELARLASVSDQRRHVNLLVAPQFLFGDGRELLGGSRAKLRDPLQEFLGDDLEAALFSAHLTDHFYLEMRMYGSVGRQGDVLARDFRERLSQLPNRIESYIDSLAPPPYWRRVSRRFPLMIGFLHDQMRLGAEGDQAVVNAVLPTEAAHNLVVASELAMASTPSPGAVAAASPAQQPARTGPQTMAEVLDQKLSYSSPQETLEFSVKNIEQAVRDDLPGLPFEFTIRIIGKDLEANGITRNQSIRDFEAKDKPLAEILTGLCMKANPITTVKEPSEEDQKLIWVIAPDPDTGKEAILITTRDAAKAKSYSLPKPFQPKG
jgi:hypothetical protein